MCALAWLVPLTSQLVDDLVPWFGTATVCTRGLDAKFRAFAAEVHLPNSLPELCALALLVPLTRQLVPGLLPWFGTATECTGGLVEGKLLIFEVE
jgi:hypothetical protein